MGPTQRAGPAPALRADDAPSRGVLPIGQRRPASITWSSAASTQRPPHPQSRRHDLVLLHHSPRRPPPGVSAGWQRALPLTRSDWSRVALGRSPDMECWQRPVKVSPRPLRTVDEWRIVDGVLARGGVGGPPPRVRGVADHGLPAALVSLRSASWCRGVRVRPSGASLCPRRDPLRAATVHLPGVA